MMDITRPLAEFVHETRFKDMPEPVVQKAKECFLDWLGVTLAGTTDPAAAIITRYSRSFGGRPEASIIGSDVRTDCASAALANGVIGHALDFDDYHDETVSASVSASVWATITTSADGTARRPPVRLEPPPGSPSFSSWMWTKSSMPSGSAERRRAAYGRFSEP
jgi:2-methylcitrate dehydratase PrpD